MSASSRNLFLAAAAVAALVPLRSLAQSDTTGVSDADIAEEVDRQLDSAPSTESPNTQLWEEYQRYRRDRDPDGLKTSGERVNFGGDVTVAEGERVEGDVVAIGGDAIVHGEVVGDVVAIGGDVVLHEGAFVDGEVVSVGGRIDERGEVEVTGDTVSIDLGFRLPLGHFRPDLELPHAPRFPFVRLTMLLVGLLIGLIFYAVAPGRLDAVSRHLETEPGQSFLIGLLCIVGSPFLIILATVLLAITVIGILLLPVLAIALVLMVAGGFFAVSLAVGRRLAHFREQGELQVARSPFFYLFLGYAGLHALQILGTLFGIGGGVLGPLGGMLGVVGFFVLLFATILGFGALITSRFGRPPAPVAAGWQVPPPPPPAPPPPPPPPPGEGSPAVPSRPDDEELPA